METSSAPGKIFVLGEHAVVYGEPALLCAIERRARVTVEERTDGGLRVDSEDLTLDGLTIEYGEDAADDPNVDVPQRLLEAATGYVDEAVAQARDAADVPDAGFEVKIESEIPLGAGLGSSAAVATAAIDAATRELGVELDKEEVAERAYQVEHTVQGGQASRADTFTSTMGGAVRVQGDGGEPIPAPEDLPIVIGYDGGAGDTGKLVSDVRALKEEYDFAADTVESIGNLVEQGQDVLADGDLEELGTLMNFNHGLLSALGVSSRSLDAMVWAARDAGARGAKLVGAGGGGCIVAIDDTDESETALEYTPGCEEAFRAELAEEGVRRE